MPTSSAAREHPAHAHPARDVVDGRDKPGPDGFRRRRLFLGLTAAFLCLFGAGLAIALNPNSKSGPPVATGPIAVHARPIAAFDPAAPSRTRFGALVYRGGLVLSSPAYGFGGWSGLRLSADGRHLLSVSDHGHWLAADVTYDGTRPSGLANAAMAPLREANGEPFPPRERDTESLEVEGTSAWIGAEGTNRIWRFDLARGIAGATGHPIAVPPEMRRGVPFNGGYEALARVPAGQPHAGALVVVTEEQLDEAGNHVAWLLDDAGAHRFAVKMRDGYAVSDMSFLPGGDLVILERRYRPPLSLRMRVRLIAWRDVQPGRTVDGEVLIEASLAQEIDNMEGISAFRAQDGTTVLTLISDDNFNPLERTLLLQFALAE
ncbi:MAG TPA: esterase-like activity of phytase family protein [Hyphomicrobiales bacterium]|nr:esterase-like activity of phytase family protein [Hyphomicrobiales bacterium]